MIPLRILLLLASTAILACAASSPSPTEPGGSSGDGKVSDRFVKLRARLDQESLQGFAMVRVRSEAMFFASADAARRGASRGASARLFEGESHRRGFAVRILQDEGEIVRVTTAVPVDEADSFAPRFELELFVRRDALVPVLRAARSNAFQDGSAYVVREGAAVSLAGDKLALAGPIVSHLPLTIEDAEVGLSFELAPGRAALPALAQADEKLACEGWGEGTRLEKQSDLIVKQRIRYPRSLAADRSGTTDPGQHHWPPCTLAADKGRGNARAALQVGGAHVAFAAEVLPWEDPCRATPMPAARAAKTGHVLIDVPLRRAELRMLAPEQALVGTGGCGTMGSVRGHAGKVLQARRGVPITFQDGKAAGKNVGGYTVLRDPIDAGDRACLKLMQIDVPLCFERAKLDLVDDVGQDRADVRRN